MEDHSGKVKVLSKKKSRKRKSLEFSGWGSKNLIEFLESLGIDTTNKISENDVIAIIMSYIRKKNREETGSDTKSNNKKKKKMKTVVCDKKLRLLFECQKINIIKLPDLIEKHYVENQDDSDYGFLYSSEDGDHDEQKRLCLSDKIDKEKKPVVLVSKPKGTFAAIVSDNIKLLYLKKSLVQELAKIPETFVSKVMGTFVRIKNPYQLVQVTGVKEGNAIDGCFLRVTNYSYYLNDVPSSALSDDDFSQEECQELLQRIKNGCVKRLTVVDMEEKVRILHEDVTKHWLARELILLQRLIDQANEKGWGRELSKYLERRELLKSPEEQSRLLREVPEVVAEEDEPECAVVCDVKIENDLMEPNPEAFIKKPLDIPKLHDEEEQPLQTVFAGNKDHHEDVKKEPANNIITQNKDSIREEDKKTTTTTQHKLTTPVINLWNKPQTRSNQPEIIVLSDDDDDDDDDGHQLYDPKKVMWWYEFPKGKTNGPFSLANLKEWSDEDFFVDIPDFKVWMTGNNVESGVLLTKLLPHIKA